MWKKFFAASAVAASIAGILGSGSVFAAETPYNGEVIDIATTSPSICVDALFVADYSGEPIVAYMWNDNYSRQVVFDDFGRVNCLMRPTVPSGTKMRFVIPMGIKNPTLSVDDNEDYTLRVKNVSHDYLRSYGSTSRRIEKSTYDIQFDANGGEGTMAAMTNLMPNTNVVLTSNGMTRAGYLFKNWNTEADGSGDSYEDGATVNFATPGVKRLYAQWIESKARLGYGPTVNAKLKTAAGTDCSGSSEPYRVRNASIKAIRLATALPDGFDIDDSANIISDSSSPVKIHAWFDDRDINEDGEGDGVIYIYSDAEVVMGASIMFGMFANMQSLSDISALAELDTSTTGSLAWVFRGDSALEDISTLAGWDTSNVRSLDSLFAFTKITNTDALETKRYPGRDYVSWDVSKVTSMDSLFWGVSTLGNISALASWDTSDVTDMDGMFGGNEVKPLSDISALATWNTSKVTTMSFMLRLLSITNVDALETKQHPGKDYVSWDVSNVKNMYQMFDNNHSLSDISALSTWNTASAENMGYMFNNTIIADVDALETKQYPGKDYVSWNVSKVTKMNDMFSYNTHLTGISALASWNVSNVTDMSFMFYRDLQLSDISALSSWNTGNVTDMSWMFNHDTALYDVSALSGWNTSSLTDMSYMFGDGTPASPMPSWYHE